MWTNIIFGGIVPFFLILGAMYLIKVYRDDNVVKWVQMAVKAAEQIYKESGKGAEKFEYVAQWISDKFNVSDDELKNLIESAVYELNKYKK